MKYAFIGRAVLGGALAGAALYFAPFLLFPLRFVLGIVFVAFLVRLVFFGWGPRRWAGRGGRHGWGGPGGRGAAFMDRVRAMSDEEYAAFKSRFGSCGPRFGRDEAPQPAPAPAA